MLESGLEPGETGTALACCTFCCLRRTAAE